MSTLKEYLNDPLHLTSKTMTEYTKTVRELRKILFDSTNYAVIGEEEMTNQEARAFLFTLNQDKVMGLIIQHDHFLIWEPQN
jgi:hypothetical protein